MGKGPLKENTNVYFQARKRAAMSNDRLFSRENAAELLGISPYTLADYELGNIKVVPVDKVVLMADLYNAPELITGYCKYECPVHGFMPLATEEKNLQGIALRLLKGLNDNDMQELKKSMVDILEDGQVTENEIEDFERILERLDSLAEVISELKLAGEKILKGR
jgi:transcriptional regulator with XRE-family HTH domain